MKDEILKSFVTTFITQNDLEDLEEDDAFERFVNYVTISRLYPREVNFEDLSTGGEDDIALDGIAIIVNGNIVNSIEEMKYLKDRNGTLNVTFALIQSKNSPKFKGEQIGNFIFGVKSFFDDKPSIPENTNIQHFRELKDKIYEYSIDFAGAPLLKLFFVTAGRWKEPEPIIGKVRRELSDLDERCLFCNKPEIEFYDAERLKNSFREISRKTVKEIVFNNHVALPDMPENLNVRQSYIGSIPVKSYLELIMNSDLKLSKELFYDNVRDFQGKNKVNEEIVKTLQSSNNQPLLALLNNGITIIAKKVEKIGSKMKLTDFQIVNGCQSSHVLFNNKTLISEDTNIVIKVIDTNDQEVINKIIRATNRQTEVKDEAFESLKPFHKDLEEFYKAMSSKIQQPIYYERRSKQYLGHPTIKPYQVISLASQIITYVATVLSQPQSTHRYFGELLESNSKNLFKDKDNLELYYLSSLISNRLESLFRNGVIYKKYRPFKFHIAFLTFSELMRKKSKDYLIKDMIITASNKGELKPIFIKSCKKIEHTLKTSKINIRDAVRSREFTQSLKY